jgi:DNA-binding NarL/FixJ family response regulator
LFFAPGEIFQAARRRGCSTSVKQSSANEVCRAIREIHLGKIFFSPSISKRFDHFDPPSSGRTGKIKKATELTSREMEVPQLVAEGNANKQTVAELGIGTKTVEKTSRASDAEIGHPQHCRTCPLHHLCRSH